MASERHIYTGSAARLADIVDAVWMRATGHMPIEAEAQEADRE